MCCFDDSDLNQDGYYEVQLEERNGGQEYSHYCVIQAASLEEAKSIARTAASCWYPTTDDEGNENPGEEIREDCFSFDELGIEVEVDSLIPVTRKEYMERAFERDQIR